MIDAASTHDGICDLSLPSSLRACTQTNAFMFAVMCLWAIFVLLFQNFLCVQYSCGNEEN